MLPASICTLLVLFVLPGCSKNIPEPEIRPPVNQKAEEPVEEKSIDWDRIGLEIGSIHMVEQAPGPYNAYNPQFTSDEEYLAYEVNVGNVKKIHVYRIDAFREEEGYGFGFERVHEVDLADTFQGELTDSFFEETAEESFNYEFSWFPASSTFLFTSNAGKGDYNIFAGAVLEDDPLFLDLRKKLTPSEFDRYLMVTEEVRKDGQAKVSPDGTRIVFSSGRSGNGDLYLYDLTTGLLQRLTSSSETDLFPQWCPRGRDVVYTTGGKTSHDIHIIRDVGTDRQRAEVLVHWFFDDVLPAFSPDGDHISFYTTYNVERDPFNTKRWGLMIIPADGSGPKAGEELIPYFHIPDVIKDNTQPAAWFPDSRHLLYAKNIDNDYNPVYIYDIQNRTEQFVDTGTDINHDLTVSPHGLISFRAQNMGWDRIFYASTTYFQEYLHEILDD
jgi:Tol biopolymer transport system component